MPEANPLNTTPRHHAPMRIGGAAFAPAVNPDAKLIRLCDRITAIERELTDLVAVRHTREDERRTQPALDVLYTERWKIESCIYQLGDPTTLAGAKAAARAALADAEKDIDGSIVANNLDSWLAMAACEFLTGSAVA